MSNDKKKGGNTSKPSQSPKPIEVPSLRDHAGKASNKGSGEPRRPVMVNPVPPPTKKNG